jgi:hypothetical protein
MEIVITVLIAGALAGLALVILALACFLAVKRAEPKDLPDIVKYLTSVSWTISKHGRKKKSPE